jgi:hypothetical protein
VLERHQGLEQRQAPNLSLSDFSIFLPPGQAWVAKLGIRCIGGKTAVSRWQSKTTTAMQVQLFSQVQFRSPSSRTRTPNWTGLDFLARETFVVLPCPKCRPSIRRVPPNAGAVRATVWCTVVVAH